MAGHSKWANIKHRKGKQDKLRGKIFTRLIRELTVAAREGGDDLSANGRLRLALEKAKQQNVPGDTIQRAIARGAGKLEGVTLEAIRYEGYGPGGVALLIDCLTDNKNRSVAEVRHALSKHGGKLGSEGSVAYLFAHRGLIVVNSAADEEAVMDCALTAGALDIQTVAEGYQVITEPKAYEAIHAALAEQFAIESAEVCWLASNEVDLAAKQAGQFLALEERLDELDDVQAVASNAAISDAVMQQIDSEE